MASDSSEQNMTHANALSSMFDWMPTCALVIDSNGIIQEVNQKAIQFFRATTKEDFIFDKQNLINMIVDSHRAHELIKQIVRSSEPVNKEILIRRFDKTIATVDFYACLFPENPSRIFIQFAEKKSHSHVYMYELSEVFRHEVQRLKPYLNKPGKSILEEIVIADLVEGIISNKTSKQNQEAVMAEERITQLTGLFPEFSNQELVFCSYLSLNMSIDEIASITGKTANSLRVSFHRILKKTSFATGKEFIRNIQAIK